MRQTNHLKSRVNKFYKTGLSLLVLISCFAFVPAEPNKSSNAGVFTYMVNDKVFTLENMTAVLRTTTGGKKQLSLSNDRFVKFFFIDPTVKDFDLASMQTKEAIVRYNEPGTNNIYTPKAGRVKISKLDINAQTLSGEFEMVLSMPGNSKVIFIKKGQFNCPIVVLR